MESCRIVLKGTLIVRNNCWQKQVFPISNHVQQRSKVTAHEWGNNFPLNSSSILNCEFCYWTVKTIRAAWGGGWFVCHSYSGLTVEAERHAWLVFTAAADLTRKESVTSSFAPFRGLVKLLHKSTPVGCIDSLFFCLTLCLEGGIVFFKKKREKKKRKVLRVWEGDVLKGGQLSSPSEECVGMDMGRHSDGTLIHLSENQNNCKNRAWSCKLAVS